MLCPKLRFREFNQDNSNWFLVIFNDYVNFYNSDRKAISKTERKEGTTPYYGANGIIDYVPEVSHDGEYVIITRSAASNLDSYPAFYTTGKVCVSDHAHVVTGKPQLIDNYFLMLRIRNMDIASHLVGGTRTQLNASTLKKIPITIPSYKEQVQIGLFFKYIDKKLNLLRDKLHLLISYKGDITYKIFNQEFRFKNKNNQLFPNWSYVQLGECINDCNNKRIELHKTKRKPGSTPYFGAANIQDYVDGFTHSGQFVLIASNGISNRFNITITYAKGDIWANTSNNVISGKNNILDTKFLYYKLKFVDLSPYTEGIKPTRLRLKIKYLKDIKIEVPCLEEQLLISNFLTKLDDKINIIQKQIDLLEQWKEWLLQQMFV